MDYIAICPKCPLIFTFGTLAAPNAPAWVRERTDVAFCPVCKTKATLAEGNETGFLKAYHQAIPHALGRKQRRELIDLLGKVASKKITPEEALAETKLSPESKKVVASIAKWTLGGIGAVTGLVSLGLGLVEHSESAREHAETMLVLNNLLDVQRATLQASASEKQAASTRSPAQSPKPSRDKTSRAPKGKARRMR